MFSESSLSMGPPVSDLATLLLPSRSGGDPFGHVIPYFGDRRCHRTAHGKPSYMPLLSKPGHLSLGISQSVADDSLPRGGEVMLSPQMGRQLAITQSFEGIRAGRIPHEQLARLLQETRRQEGIHTLHNPLRQLLPNPLEPHFDSGKSVGSQPLPPGLAHGVQHAPLRQFEGTDDSLAVRGSDPRGGGRVLLPQDSVERPRPVALFSLQKTSPQLWVTPR